ncbi:unknown; predicted coding region [Mycoplasmopsis pulmonis]|uniref:Uncharacterized protein n=1 Tax=Mycoplasmopsis pulmonis (strain UAB CTIP) TaxID=272635 RepID=Q98QB4_MYCPU|nr:unknown; predicted coding region [Mycoplasmopsis pulmonis]
MQEKQENIAFWSLIEREAFLSSWKGQRAQKLLPFGLIEINLPMRFERVVFSKIFFSISQRLFTITIL